MANNHRTFWSIIAPITFPAQVTTFIHRLRGVHVGMGSKIARSVLIDDSRPDLVNIGRNVWVTARYKVSHGKMAGTCKTRKASRHALFWHMPTIGPGHPTPHIRYAIRLSSVANTISRPLGLHSYQG